MNKRGLTDSFTISRLGCISEWRRTNFWGQDAMEMFKIFTVSKGVNEIRLQLYLFFKVREDAFLHTGPNRLLLPPQKLVFKVKLRGEADPVGVWGLEPP